MVKQLPISNLANMASVFWRACAEVATLSNLGCNVIVDDLLFKPAYLADYVEVLNPDSTWFISVTCSLEIVREREASRPGRFPGTAVSHFEQVHAHGGPYDLTVDTSRKNSTTVA